MTIDQAIERIGYLNGYIEAVTDYAIWKDGQQLVGCLQRPLKEVIDPLKKERDAILRQLEQE